MHYINVWLESHFGLAEHLDCFIQLFFSLMLSTSIVQLLEF